MAEAKIKRQVAMVTDGTPSPWASRTKMDEVAAMVTPNKSTT
jgi:hypothetical protein